MKTSIFKKGVSVFMAMLMCLSALVGIDATTVFAAGTESEVCMISFPRDGDANYDGTWGHRNLQYMNGWSSGESDYTTVRAMGTFESNICYCIEPGIPLNIGDRLTDWDENFWDNYPSSYNQTIAPDDIKLFIGRIMQYGYTGTISTEWRSQNEGADKLAHAVATQLLIWETVLGERDADFSKVGTGGYDAVLDQISADHPLRSQIMSYYNSMAESVQTHSKLPSFLARSAGRALNIELEWDGEKYTATEQTYDKYEPQESRQVVIVSGRTATVTFNNTLRRGDLVVTKTAEDGLTEGIKFHLSGTSLSGIAVDEYAVTDSTGKACFNDVLIGSGYVLEEVDTPIRYVVPDDQTAAVEWNKVTQKSFDNRLKKWNATVTKSNSETGSAQGDASLAGAVYGVYDGEELIDTYVTDAAGQFTTDYYVCGDDWSIREITPSEGYSLDETSHHVGAEAKLYTVEYNSTALEINEQIIKGNIAIIKHTDDGETQIETPETGATFEVYLKSAGSYEAAKETERDILTCDENGFAQSKDMPYGVYTVHQTYGWDGRELMTDFDVFICKDSQTYRYLINNSNFESFVKVVKVDAETGKPIPYAGAGFQLYRPDGSLITQTFTYPTVTTIDTFYTNDEGYLITPESLEYGTGYALVEVEAPFGYVRNSDPVYFDVTADNATEDSTVVVVEVVKKNMAQKGVIKVGKTGEVFASVTESDGVYQPVYAVQGLPGAVYEITAAEDIYTPDGTLRYAAGEMVATITKDETGSAQTEPLYLGRYTVKEITAPYGMTLNEETRTVELTYAGQEIEITETATSFYNERQKAILSLLKAMEQNGQFGIGGNGEITAVTFGLYAAEDLTAADGSMIPADGLLEIISVNENGSAACMTDLPFGSYYLKEISTDSHYILSNKKYPVVFEYAGQDTALVEIKANEGKAIDNDLIYGEIHGLKKDEDGNALTGALIGLFRTDETEYTAENALLTATSAEDGSFYFTRVPYGNWVVREIEAPTGFVLSDTAYPAAVNEDGAVIEVEIENIRIRGNVQITKVDKDYPDNKLTGAEFEVYADLGDNQELDDGDEKLSTLSEVSIGIYR